MREHYVYALFRPCGEVCYIGKGKGDRIHYHENTPGWKSQAGLNRHLINLIKSLSMNDQRLDKLILRFDLTDEDACLIEKALIKAIGREIEGGPLFNITEGGEGTSGRKHSLETIEKIRKAHIGLKPSPETRAKIGAKSRLRRGWVPSPETRAKISAARRRTR